MQVNAISFSEHHTPAPEQPSRPHEASYPAHDTGRAPEAYANGDSDPPGPPKGPGGLAEGHGGSPGGWSWGRQLHRHAVLEADVTNRTDLALQVISEPAWLSLALHDGCWGLDSRQKPAAALP